METYYTDEKDVIEVIDLLRLKDYEITSVQQNTITLETKCGKKMQITCNQQRLVRQEHKKQLLFEARPSKRFCEVTTNLTFQKCQNKECERCLLKL